MYRSTAKPPDDANADADVTRVDGRIGGQPLPSPVPSAEDIGLLLEEVPTPKPPKR